MTMSQYLGSSSISRTRCVNFIAGAAKKNLSLDVTSETVEGRGRIIDQPRKRFIVLNSMGEIRSGGHNVRMLAVRRESQ